MTPDPGRRVPLSTYRLQLSREFDFARAAAIVPDLARLGVDACYCSPILKARAGSPHGYDIVDHREINPELGGETAFRQFVDVLHEHGMKLVLDFVPNHMAADVNENPWWRDVVEHGPASPHAVGFDIDWAPLKSELRNRLLLPILGDHYGRVLERGELVLDYDGSAFIVRYRDRRLPINARHIPFIVGHDSPRLAAEADDDIRRALATLNGTPGDAASFDRLHELLERQPYRLAYWRVAGHEINYRRFFDVNDLAAIRIERQDVFDATHASLAQWLGDRMVDGVRVDHPDGLFDPAAYVERLAHLGGIHRPYVVVEKILSAGERLPAWPVDGTTGYEFLNEVGGLFVDASAARRMQRTYGQVAGRQERLADVVYESKKHMIVTSLSSELNVLADALNRLSERDRRSRDFPHDSLRDLLIEVVACFPVYRTYVSPRGVSESDIGAIDTALAEARRRNRQLGRSIFEFLRCVLLPAGLPGVADTGNRFEPRADFAERLQFSMTFQQYTAPVQAKGVEDTAFYRYSALVSLNEVGGDPGRFGRSPAEFHDANASRLSDRPGGMLATSTHDSKLGEDTRLRIHALSELADDWRTAVTRWQRLTASARRSLDDGWAPEGADVYRFYQALIGIWPAGRHIDDEVIGEVAVRLRAYMSKTIREAKSRTSWLNENPSYEAAVDGFVTQVLTGKPARKFLKAVAPLAERAAGLGALYSLAQLVLKLDSPGVADCYQGTETWSLTLVDPDNRRPIDFGRRSDAIADIAPLLEGLNDPSSRADLPALKAAAKNLSHAWRDGRIKLYVTAAGLRLRRTFPELFLNGDYVPLEVEPSLPARAVALARRFGDSLLVAIVPRLVAAISPTVDPGPGTPCMWGDTRVLIPDGLGTSFVNVLTGERVRTGGSEAGRTSIALSPLFENFPVAWLWASSTT